MFWIDQRTTDTSCLDFGRDHPQDLGTDISTSLETDLLYDDDDQLLWWSSWLKKGIKP